MNDVKILIIIFLDAMYIIINAYVISMIFINVVPFIFEILSEPFLRTAECSHGNTNPKMDLEEKKAPETPFKGSGDVETAYNDRVKKVSSRLSYEETMKAKNLANDKLVNYKYLIGSAFFGGLSFIGKQFLSNKITPSMAEELSIKFLATAGISSVGLLTVPVVENFFFEQKKAEFLSFRKLQGDLLNSAKNDFVAPVAFKAFSNELLRMELDNDRFVRPCDRKEYDIAKNNIAFNKALLSVLLSDEVNKPLTSSSGISTASIFKDSGTILEVENTISKLEKDISNYHKIGDNFIAKSYLTYRCFKD